MTTRRAALGATLVTAALVAVACTGDVSSRSATTASTGTTMAATPSAAAPATPTAGAHAAPSPTPTASQAGHTSWGPTSAQLERAGGIVSGLSVRELAGQVIVATYAGTAAPVGLVEQHHLGGVIVMSENAPTVEHASRAMAQLQRADDRPYPLWLSVDQEGGIVARLGAPMTGFPTYMSHGAARDQRVTTMAARASGEELRGAGFTVVYAPVADVTTGPGDPTIGSRSAGSDPALVARSVAASVRGYLKAGIVPVIKHFPGHGSVPQDSHEVLAVQSAPLSTLKRRDLVPFQRSIDAGAPAVMVGHLDLQALDAGLPSSLSHRVVTGLLRHRLGFRGVVVTDALDMAAVVDTYGAGEAAVLSLLAGDDVLLMPTDIPRTIGAIVSAVDHGRLPRQRLEQAAQRMIALLLHQRDMPDRRSAPGVHGQDALALSRAAVTQVSGPCGARLVGDAVAPSGAPDAVAVFKDAARQAGLVVGSGTTVHFVGYLDPPGVADIVVTTDAPYALGSSTAEVAKIALYGQTRRAMRALVEVLMAERTAPGRLPVDVDGSVRRGC